MKKGREILTSETDKKDDYIGDAKHVTFRTEDDTEQNDVAINMHSIIVSFKEHAKGCYLNKSIFQISPHISFFWVLFCLGKFRCGSRHVEVGEADRVRQ